MDISQYFFEVDAQVLGVALIAAIMLLAEGAFRFGRWMHRTRGLEADASFSVVEGGILGLIALILGFSFSLAGARFDSRQAAVITEANAIGTTFLRSSFLDADERPSFRLLMQQYTRERLDRYNGYGSSVVRERTAKRTTELQRSIWHIVADEANRRPSQNTMILTQTTNEMFDSAGALDASLENHVPGTIVLLVLLSSLAGAVMVGLGFGLGSASHVSVSVLYALIVALLVTTTLDLDRPSRGLIQLHLTPFSDQLQFMAGEK